MGYNSVFKGLSLQNGKLRQGSSDSPVRRPTSRKTDLQQLQKKCVNETRFTVSAEGVETPAFQFCARSDIWGTKHMSVCRSPTRNAWFLQHIRHCWCAGCRVGRRSETGHVPVTDTDVT